MDRSPPLERRGFSQDVLGDRSAYLDDPVFRSGAPPAPPPPQPPAPSSGSAYLDFLIPAAVATAVFVAGPLLLPDAFRVVVDPKNGVLVRPRPDPLMWGLTSVALAAVAYALIALYRSF